MLIELAEFSVILGLMTGFAMLMGEWLTRVFTDSRHTVPERWTYRLLGVDPGERMSWRIPVKTACRISARWRPSRS